MKSIEPQFFRAFWPNFWILQRLAVNQIISQFSPRCCWRMGLLFLFLLVPTSTSVAQEKQKKSDETIIKGSLEFDVSRKKSWDGVELIVPLDQLPTKLYKQVELPPAPLPQNWAEMTADQRRAWIQEFEASESGIAFLADRQRRIANAQTFEVLIEPDGKFVIYDIPVGFYGIRGEIEKEISGTLYAFEVFGQIEVRDGMDEIRLNPIQIAVTPLLQPGQVAPPFEVKALEATEKIQLSDFLGKYLVISFWMADSPTADYQKMVQESVAELQSKYQIQLLSVSVDANADDTLRRIRQNKLNYGSHAFAGDFNHQMLFDYGVRSLPTLWLIDPEGKISLSQIDFAIALGQEPDLKVIITDRIEGKEPPSAIAVENTEARSDNQDKAGNVTDR